MTPLFAALPPPSVPLLVAAASDLENATEDPVRLLAVVLLGALVLAGVGCLLAVLRIVFPGPAARADAAVRSLGAGRLLLTGILPVLGVALVGHGAQAGGAPAQTAWVLLFFLPTLALVLLGASALVPHVGRHLLRPGERSLLARAVTGALALGLAFAAAAVLGREAGASILALLLSGWFFSAGFGALGRRRDEAKED